MEIHVQIRAADVAIPTSFGTAQLARFVVVTDELTESSPMQVARAA
jgi:hypothetical protein